MVFNIFHIVRHIRTERAIAVALWSTLVLVLCSYVYFIVSAVVHVMLRQELMVRIQNVETHVSALEAEYLARTEDIAATRIADTGLIEIKHISYVPLKQEGRVSRLP